MQHLCKRWIIFAMTICSPSTTQTDLWTTLERNDIFEPTEQIFEVSYLQLMQRIFTLCSTSAVLPKAFQIWSMAACQACHVLLPSFDLATVLLQTCYSPLSHFPIYLCLLFLGLLLALAHLYLPFVIICMNYHWCASVVSRHWHWDGEDRALSVANALIHHPNIEPSVERNHCLHQANTQE